MAIQPYLTMLNKSSSTSELSVFQDFNGQLVRIGEPFGTIEYTVPISIYRNISAGKVIHWQNALYAVGYDRIWKYTIESGIWNPVYQFISQSASNRTSLGLWPLLDNNVPILVTAYTRNASNNCTIVEFNSDYTATEYPFTRGATFTTAYRWRDPTIVNNKLYWIQHGNGASCPVYEWDISAKTLTNAGLQITDEIGLQGGYGPSLFVKHNNIYLYSYRYTPVEARNFPSVWKRLGSTSYKTIFTFPYERTSVSNESQNTTAFPYGEYVYFIDNINTPEITWKMYALKIEEDDTVSEFHDVTTQVFPSEFLTGGRKAGIYYYTLWNRKYDNLSNGGSGLPTVYLEYRDTLAVGQNNEYESCAIYRFNGSGDVMTLIGARPEFINYSSNTDIDGTSCRIWGGSGTLNVSLPKIINNGPNIDISFTVYGNNESNIAVGFLNSIPAEKVNNLCTLENPSHGSLSGNYIIDITADNTTEYTVTWKAQEDGVSNSNSPRLAGYVFATGII